MDRNSILKHTHNCFTVLLCIPRHCEMFSAPVSVVFVLSGQGSQSIVFVEF